MQVRALEQNTGNEFKQAKSELATLRRQRSYLQRRLSNMDKRGRLNPNNYARVKNDLDDIDLEIAKCKDIIRSLLPEGVIEKAVDDLISKSTEVLRALEIFTGWYEESYHAPVSVEYLQSKFESNHYSLVQGYRLARMRLQDEHFAFDLEDFKEIDELVKICDNYQYPEGSELTWEDFLAELALRLSTDIQKVSRRANEHSDLEEL